MGFSTYVNTETFSSALSTLKIPETKKAESANSVGLDEVAYNEPHHLDLHYLPSSLLNSQMI